MNLIPLIIVLVVISVDILSGLAAAAKRGDINSTKMRDGLFSKCGSIVIEGLAFFASTLIVLFPEFPMDLSGVYIGVSVYIIIMEIVSIIENSCELNPRLSATKLAEFFKVNK